VWSTRILLMEAVFLLIFTQWYASRYFHWGSQLPFAAMIALIFGLWAVILGIGVWRDKRSTPQSGSMDKQSSPVDKSRA